jgi:deoxyribodipyrimidine photo-lyase
MNGPAFPATRSEALSRLTQFVPHAGGAYAAGGNTDPGSDAPGAVSKLSPYVRYRLITEREIVAAVLIL